MPQDNQQLTSVVGSSQGVKDQDISLLSGQVQPVSRVGGRPDSPIRLGVPGLRSIRSVSTGLFPGPDECHWEPARTTKQKIDHVKRP